MEFHLKHITTTLCVSGDGTEWGSNDDVSLQTPQEGEEEEEVPSDDGKCVLSGLVPRSLLPLSVWPGNEARLAWCMHNVH